MYVLIFSHPSARAIGQNEKVIAFAIRVRVVQDAFGFLLIPTGSPALLHVALQALRYRVMYNKSHILFVDTHAKCNSSDNDL